MSNTAHQPSNDPPPAGLNPRASERGGAGAPEPPFIVRFWRHGLLILLVAEWLVHCLHGPPEKPNLAYHHFADQRSLLGIPNFSDVTSNLPFLLVGVAGLWLGQPRRFAIS